MRIVHFFSKYLCERVYSILVRRYIEDFDGNNPDNTMSVVVAWRNIFHTSYFLYVPSPTDAFKVVFIY